MTVRRADEVFDQEFLLIRAKLLEVAASLDRVARAGEGPVDSQRSEQIRQAIEVLLREGDDRAKTIQQIFSLPYDDAWRKEFDLP